MYPHNCDMRKQTIRILPYHNKWAPPCLLCKQKCLGTVDICRQTVTESASTILDKYLKASNEDIQGIGLNFVSKKWESSFCTCHRYSQSVTKLSMTQTCTRVE